MFECLTEDLISYKHFFFVHPHSTVTDVCYGLRYFLSIAADTVFFSVLGSAYWLFLVYFLSVRVCVDAPFLCNQGQRNWCLSQCCPLVNNKIHRSTSAFWKREWLQQSFEPLFSLSGAMALKFWRGFQLRIGDYAEAQVLSLQVLYQRWGKVQSQGLRRRPCQGSRDMLRVLLQLRGWNCLQVGEKWYRVLQYDPVSPVRVCPHMTSLQALERCVPPSASLPAAACRGLFPSLLCVALQERRVCCPWKESSSRNLCSFEPPGSPCWWKMSSRKLLVQPPLFLFCRMSNPWWGCTQ